MIRRNSGALRFFWQLFPSFLFITFAVLLFVAWFANSALRTFYEERTETALKSELRIFVFVVNSLLEAGTDQSREIDRVCKLLGEQTSTRYTVIDINGRVLGDTEESPEKMENHAGRKEIRTALNEKAPGSDTRVSTTLGKEYMYTAFPVLDDSGVVIGVVRASRPTTDLNISLAVVQQRIAMGAILAAALTTAVSWFLARQVSHPLEIMTSVASRFASGSLEHRLRVEGAAEINELADSLNAMAAQLDDRIRQIVRERNERDAVLASMVEGVLAVDSDGVILSLNEAGGKMLHLDAPEMVGRNAFEVINDADLLGFLEKVLSREFPSRFHEQELVIHQEEDRYLNAHGTKLRDGELKEIGALLVLHDVTRLQKLENIRREFVANVTHELRTPITSIKGYVETLLDGALDDRGDSERFLQVVLRQADHLNAVVGDILSLARIERMSEEDQVPLVKGNICDVLEAAVQMCSTRAADKHISVSMSCEPGLETLYHFRMLNQAVVNLIDNAVNYSPAGSHVAVEAKRDSHGIVIQVVDQGCGIEARHLPRLFERFYRVDKARSRSLGGTGLGLAIVKHISRIHNGSVSVESEPGAGSTFRIHLPLSA